MDQIKREDTGTEAPHDESALTKGGVRLVMTPTAQRDEIVRIEVGSPLRPLDDMVDVEPGAQTACLAPPTGASLHELAERSPLRPRGGRSPLRTRPARPDAAARGLP